MYFCKTFFVMEGEVKIKVKFTLEQATRTQTGIWVIALIFNLGAWWQCVLSMARPSRFTPEKVPVRVVQEAGRVPVLVWTGAENFAPTWIQSPASPVYSDTLYRLRYLCPRKGRESATVWCFVRSLEVAPNGGRYYSMLCEFVVPFVSYGIPTCACSVSGP